MINGMHALIYSRDAEADRAFFRDVLEWPHVDARGGWLIFALPPAELGVHPTEEAEGSHELHLMCDDVAATVKALKAKGVKFTGAPQDMGYGLVTAIRLPGGGTLGLYEPRHPSPLGLAGKTAAAEKPAAREKPAAKKMTKKTTTKKATKKSATAKRR
jgi:predicted enzyme related to lactoylglutathione lyase